MSSLSLRAYHYVTITASGIAAVKVLLGEEAPKITGSGAKWDVVDRRRRAGMTVYRGRDPVEQTISVLFDGYLARQPVDLDMAALDRMSRPTPTGSRPPLVHITGSVLRKDIKNWIISDVIWGDNVVKELIEGSPATLRADAVITLTEFIEPDNLELPGTQSIVAGTGKDPPKQKFHVVARGETLNSIAVAVYGDHNRWRDIAKANNIRDPNHPPVGKRLRMP